MIVYILRKIVEQVLLNDYYLEKQQFLRQSLFDSINDNITYIHVNLFCIMKFLNIIIIIKSMFWSKSETFFNVKQNKNTRNKRSKQV